MVIPAILVQIKISDLVKDMDLLISMNMRGRLSRNIIFIKLMVLIFSSDFLFPNMKPNDDSHIEAKY